jgi:hypothetical protein
MKATISLEIPDSLCLDFLTTCVEGGSAYWLACDHVDRDAEHNVIKIAGCFDREEDDNSAWGDADIGTMQLGIQRILDGSVKVRSDISGTILQALIDQDKADWDAETADCVLQAGLFNEIVYG